MTLGDKQLIVQRASVGAKGGIVIPDDPSTMAMPINIPGLQVPSESQNASTVLCLMNMVTEDELVDDEEYEGRLNCKESWKNCVLCLSVSLLTSIPTSSS